MSKNNAFLLFLAFYHLSHLPRVLHLLDKGLRLVGVDLHHGGVHEPVQLGRLVVQVDVLMIVALDNLVTC